MFYFDFVSEDVKDSIEKLLIGGRLPCPRHLLNARWEYLPQRPKVGEYSHDEQLSYQQSKREGSKEELRAREKV